MVSDEVHKVFQVSATEIQVTIEFGAAHCISRVTVSMSKFKPVSQAESHSNSSASALLHAVGLPSGSSMCIGIA